MTTHIFRRLILLAALCSVSAVAASVTGRVVDAAGKPVRDVTVIASNTLFYNSNVIGYTDANGKYRLDISQPRGTWNVTASLTFKYAGQNINIELIPENPRVLAGTEGGVRNFTYRPKPLTPDDPYGNLGHVQVSKSIDALEELDLLQVELTLTPVGKLADGSAGNVIKARLRNTSDGPLLANVMYGTYRITAALQGKPLQISRRPRPGTNEEYAWSSSYTGPFVMGFYKTTPTIFLEVKP